MANPTTPKRFSMESEGFKEQPRKMQPLPRMKYPFHIFEYQQDRREDWDDDPYLYDGTGTSEDVNPNEGSK